MHVGRQHNVRMMIMVGLLSIDKEPNLQNNLGKIMHACMDGSMIRRRTRKRVIAQPLAASIDMMMLSSIAWSVGRRSVI